MDKFNIEMPDDLDIKNQINIILDNGLPSKQSFYMYIKDMYKTIGLKNLFHDLSELIFIGVLVVSILAFSTYMIFRNEFVSTERIYSFIFMISPLFYLATNLFSYMNMKDNNTYEMEMICKFNLYQVASLRMLVFSVISIVLNTIVVVALYERINVFRGMMISFTSIFLFSVLLLYLILKTRSYIAKGLVIVGWIMCNGTLMRWSEVRYFKFLESLPVFVYFVVTTVSVIIYIRNIQIVSSYKKIEIS
ncbi:MAG: hypothetical protein ACRCXA_10100 [Peptostreptococcaceae bacterium]